MQFQSSLGNVTQENRSDIKMNGYTSLGRIIKIHHKKNTADVKIVRTNDVISSLAENEGRFACKILTVNAHFNKDTCKSNGVIEPLTEGELVVIGFLEGRKTEPIILGSLHRLDDTDNILPSEYPINMDNRREYLKYLRVFPSQDYIRVDGDGNFEVAFHGKSFFKFDDTGINDSHNGTDFKNLYEKDKFTGNTLTMEDKSYHKPKDFIAVFRDNWIDDITTWTKFLVQSNGLIRISRDNNDNSLTFVEVNKLGEFKVRRQIDTNLYEDGATFSELVISKSGVVRLNRNNFDGFSALIMHEDNTVTLETKDKGKIVITLNKDGKLNIETSNSISIKSKKDIDINAEGDLNLRGSRIFLN